jgi:hypothetical protein
MEPRRVVLVVIIIAGLATSALAIFKPDALITPPGRKITRTDALVFLVGRTGARVTFVILGLGISALCAFLLLDSSF